MSRQYLSDRAVAIMNFVQALVSQPLNNLTFSTDSDSSEQPKNQDDNKNRAEKSMRPIPKTITARRERADQQQDNND
jgi:hypothetical protein